MSRRVFTLVLTTVVACSFAAPGRAAARAVCGPASHHTVAQSQEARAYNVGNSVWACARGRRHRRFRLGYRDGCGGSSGCLGVIALHVAGPLIAYGDYFYDVAFGDAFFTVWVRDVRTGRARFHISQGVVAVQEVFLDDLVLDQHGHVAWIWSHYAEPFGPEERELWRSPGCGPRVLDSDPRLGTASLRLRDDVVSWQVGEQRRQVVLCPNSSG